MLNFVIVFLPTLRFPKRRMHNLGFPFSLLQRFYAKPLPIREAAMRHSEICNQRNGLHLSLFCHSAFFLFFSLNVTQRLSFLLYFFFSNVKQRLEKLDRQALQPAFACPVIFIFLVPRLAQRSLAARASTHTYTHTHTGHSAVEGAVTPPANVEVRHTRRQRRGIIRVHRLWLLGKRA